MASQPAAARQQSSQHPSSSTASPQAGRSSPSHSAHSEDSQTVLLNTPTVEPSSSEPKNIPRGIKQQSQAPSSDEPRKCWICFSDETEDSPLSSEWRSPCPCALTAHESCLLDWVADREAPQQNGSGRPQKIECPQCRAEIRIARPRSRIVEWHRRVEDAVRRLFWPGIVTSLVAGLGAASVLHGASTVYLLLGTKDADFLLGVQYGRMPSANTLLGLASVPGILMLSSTKAAESFLPVLPIIYAAIQRPTYKARHLWPPSVAMTLATLPYIQVVYRGFMKKVFQEREKQWVRQIQPRAGEVADNAENDAQEQAAVVDEPAGGLNFELGVELEIIEEEEVPIQPGQQQELINEIHANQLGAEDNRQGQNQNRDETQGRDARQQANPPQRNAQGRNHGPPPMGNDAPHAGQDQNPAPLGEQHRVIRLVPLVSAFVHTMIGALAFPAVAAGMGDLISVFLPRTWKVPPGVWDRRSPGFLQSRFGRSVAGGCLFLVLKDTLSLYSKYRLAQDHMHRRVLDYDGKGRKAQAGG
ncbi:MAG: hypothetical protein Q9201_005635 [Fulgogasparrea decipioides]